MITIYDSNGVAILDVENVGMQHVEELMKSDYVSFTWVDVERYNIPVGAYIVPFDDDVHYMLLDVYEPAFANEASFGYSPQFHHPKMYLSKVPFRRSTKDAENNDLSLIEWPYTGGISELLKDFCNAINTVFGFVEDDEKFTYEIIGDIKDIVTVSFNCNDILSALTNTANVEECEWHIDWRNRILYFGHIAFDRYELETPVLKVDESVRVPSTNASREGYWNAYEPQGSSRNITRKAASGGYVQATVRLSLRDYSREGGGLPTYPDGIMYVAEAGDELHEGELITTTPQGARIITKEAFERLGHKMFLKTVVLEDVYPRQELYVYDIRYRERDLLEEYENTDGTKGKRKVIDHYDNGTPVYKRYAVWYLRLAYPILDTNGEAVRWIQFSLNENVISVKTSRYEVFSVPSYHVDIYTNIKYRSGMFNEVIDGTHVLWIECNEVKVRSYVYLTNDYLCFRVRYLNDNDDTVNSWNDYEAFVETFDGSFTVVDGESTVDFPVYGINYDKFPNTKIIEGKKPIMAFQPNKRSDAFPFPLAGRGNGDGDSHYGFEINYKSTQEEADSDNEAIRAEMKADSSDTGVIDTAGTASKVLQGDYEIIMQNEGDTLILPTTKEEMITPNGEKSPTLRNNIVCLYNIAVSDDYEFTAKVELENETIKKIDHDKADNNTYTLTFNPCYLHEKGDPDLYIGRKVIYDDGHGYSFETRVMGITTKLDGSYETTVTVGNEVIKGQTTTFKEQVQRMIIGGNGIGGGGSISESHIIRLIRDWVTPRFLSKIYEDAAERIEGFVKGLWVKEKGKYGFSEEGSIKAKDGEYEDKLSAAQGIIGKINSPNFHSGEIAGAGWQLTDNAENGTSRLEVDTIVARMKFVASVLETRKYVSMGGNYVFSPAAGIIEQVDYIKDTEEGGQPKREVMGYSNENVPWLIRLVPLRLGNVLLSMARKTKHNVKRSEAADMKSEATVFRCYLKADDGTTATVNTWQVGMLVRCQTFDVEKSELGTYTDETFTDAVQNTFYWREIVAVGKGRMPIDDGYDHHYIDLSNETYHYHENSDIPSPGDNIVCFGSTKKDTSHFIVIETVGADAPALKEYRGVGLVNIHRDNNTQGYTGETPNFNLADCRRTMISPTSGNEFFAPRYYIETDDDTEQLYIEHYKGEAATIITRTTEIYPTPELVTDDVMLVQDRFLGKPKAYKANASGRLEEISVRYGDIWYVLSNSKVYMAKADKWEERGDYIVKERFAQEVKGDTEQSIATSMGFIDPVSGEPEWENVGEYIRSSTENISRLTRAAKYGKNMLSGTLTGTGWVSGSMTPVTVKDGIFTSTDKRVVSPLVQLYEGSFTFSFYTQSLAVDGNGVVKARVKLFYPIVQELTSIQIFNTGESSGNYQRYRATISRSRNDQMRVFVALDVTDDNTQANAKLYLPQLEQGDEATEFASSEREVSSLIKQTANGISLKVNEGLASTGIDIEHKKIRMTADSFTLENLIGNQVLGVNEDGNLELLGTIFADSIFKKVLFAYHYSDTQAELAYMNYDGTISNDMYVYIHSTDHFADFDDQEQDGKTYEDYGVAVGKCMRWSGEVAARYGDNADADLVYCTPPVDHIIAVDSQDGSSYYDADFNLRIPPSWKYIGKVLEIWNMKVYGHDLYVYTVSWQDAEQYHHGDNIISRVIMNASEGEIEAGLNSNPRNVITVQYGERVRLLATPVGWLQL